MDEIRNSVKDKKIAYGRLFERNVPVKVQQ